MSENKLNGLLDSTAAEAAREKKEAKETFASPFKSKDILDPGQRAKIDPVKMFALLLCAMVFLVGLGLFVTFGSSVVSKTAKAGPEDIPRQYGTSLKEKVKEVAEIKKESSGGLGGLKFPSVTASAALDAPGKIAPPPGTPIVSEDDERREDATKGKERLGRVKRAASRNFDQPQVPPMPLPEIRRLPSAAQRGGYASRTGYSQTSRPASGLDAMVAWQQLAGVGSFGSANAASADEAQAGAAAATTLPQGGADSATAAGRRRFELSESKKLAQSVQSNQFDLKAEQAILDGRPRYGAVVGKRTTGVLETPVVYEARPSRSGGGGGGGSGNTRPKIDEEDRYVIRLVEPLVSGGQIVLPVGTQVITRVASISAGGLVRMVGVAAVLADDREVELPDETVGVRGEGGSALYARNVTDKGGEIAGMDLGQFALAGIGKAAELYNRATSQTTVSGVGGFSTATEFPPPNPVAGFLQGGVESLLPQLSSRNQTAIRNALGRPNVWMLPAGTAVQIFLNKSLPPL